MIIKPILEVLKEYYIGETVTVYEIEIYNYRNNTWVKEGLLYSKDNLPETHRVAKELSVQVVDVTYISDGYEYNEVNLEVNVDGNLQCCEIRF